MTAEINIKNILILDDNRDFRVLLKTYLEKDFQNADIVEYDPVGRGAPPDDFDWSAYDVMILDYYLCIYGLTGLDLLQKHRKKPGFPATIMLTGAGNEAVAVRALKFGVNEYLSKVKLSREVLAEAIINAYREHVVEQKKQGELERASNSFDKALFYKQLEHPNGPEGDGPDRVFLLIDVDNYDALAESIGLIIRDNLVNHIAQNSYEIFNLIKCNPSITRFSDSSVALLIDFPGSTRDLKVNIQELCSQLAVRPYKFGDKSVDYTVSIGILLLTNDGHTVETLVNQVNLARDIARQNPANSYHIYTGSEILDIEMRRKQEEERHKEEKEKLHLAELEKQQQEKNRHQQVEEQRRREEEKKTHLAELEKQRLEEEMRQLQEDLRRKEEQLRLAELENERQEEAQRQLKEEQRNKEEQLRLAELEKQRQEDEKLQLQEALRLKEEQSRLTEFNKKQQDKQIRQKEEEKKRAKEKEKLRLVELEKQRQEEEKRQFEENQKRIEEERQRREEEEKLRIIELENLRIQEEKKRKEEERKLHLAELEKKRLEDEKRQLQESLRRKEEQLRLVELEKQQQEERRKQEDEKRRNEQKEKLRLAELEKQRIENEKPQLELRRQQHGKDAGKISKQHASKSGPVEMAPATPDKTRPGVTGTKPKNTDSGVPGINQPVKSIDNKLPVTELMDEETEIDIFAFPLDITSSNKVIPVAASNAQSVIGSQKTQVDEIEINDAELDEGSLRVKKAFDNNMARQSFQPVVAMFSPESKSSSELFKVILELVNVDGSIDSADMIKSQVKSITLQQHIDHWKLRKLIGRIVNDDREKTTRTYLITISEAWLTDITLFNWLKKLLTGVEDIRPGKCIILELPEETLMKHMKRAIPLVTALKKNFGFQIALGKIKNSGVLKKFSKSVNFDLLIFDYKSIEEMRDRNPDNKDVTNLLIRFKGKNTRIIVDGVDNATVMTEAINAGADYVMGDFIGTPQSHLSETSKIESFEIS